MVRKLLKWNIIFIPWTKVFIFNFQPLGRKGHPLQMVPSCLACNYSCLDTLIIKIWPLFQKVYGSNFSEMIFCQMNVTFSSTLSINYTKFYYRMIKTKIFSDISFQIRVIIYLQINSKLAVCLSICLSIFL